MVQHSTVIIYAEEIKTYIHRKICSRMFLAVLFITQKVAITVVSINKKVIKSTYKIEYPE